MKKLNLWVLIICIVLSTSICTTNVFAADDFKWQLNSKYAVSYYNDIAASSEGMDVIVGDDGCVTTSDDGNTWIKQIPPTTSTLNSIIWINGIFVSVGELGEIITSNDGVNWQVRNSGTKLSLRKVLYDGNKFVAVGGGYNLKDKKDISVILFSYDGIVWTDSKCNLECDFYEAEFKDGNFILSSLDNDLKRHFYYSNDGLIWSEGPEYTFDNRTVWSGKNYARLDTSLQISEDGTRWRDVNYPSNGYGLKKVIWDGKQYIAAGGHNELITSKDGETWISHCDKKFIHLSAIVWNGEKFLIVGAEGLVLESVDGIFWTEIKPFTYQALKDVIWDGSQFVALGFYGEIFTSKNGDKWAKTAVNDTEYASKIIYTGKQYIAIGGSSTIYTSPDLINWTKRDSGCRYGFDSIVWNGNILVAVGMFGAVYTSYDGVTWTKQNAHTANDFKKIIWNGSKFLAVGDWYLISQSSDGINWGSTAEDHQYLLSDAIWDGSKFIIMHGWGDILTSRDGKSWETGKFAASLGEFKAVWNGEKIVVIGGYGSIVSSSNPDVIKVKVNNKPIVFDIAPLNRDGRNLVPLRAIFNALGANVEWDSSTRTITGTKGDIKIVLKLDNNIAIVNGINKTLDVPATSVNGRTMVPARFISESLGAEVVWDGETQTVIITSK